MCRFLPSKGDSVSPHLPLDWKSCVPLDADPRQCFPISRFLHDEDTNLWQGMRERRWEPTLEIEIAWDGAGYVVTIPNSETMTTFSVRFTSLQDAEDLATACADWFSDCIPAKVLAVTAPVDQHKSAHAA